MNMEAIGKQVKDAIDRNDLEVLRRLVRESPENSLREQLEDAARKNKVEYVRIILENRVTDLGYAFQLACENFSLETIPLLLPQSRTNEEWMREGFESACYNNHLEVVKFL